MAKSPSSGGGSRGRPLRPRRPFTVRFDSNVPPVRRTLGQVLRRVYQIYMAMTMESVAEADLRPLQYGAMAILNKEDGEPGIDQNGLGARLGTDRNSTSKLVDNLEAKGLVERRVNGADRRARLLSLTQEGEKLFARLHERNIGAQARVLAPLSATERELLFSLLLRLIAVHGAAVRSDARGADADAHILSSD